MMNKIEEIIKLLEPHVEFAFLMGSYGTARFNEQSDIDIAAYFSEATAEPALTKLLIELMDLLDREVDLVNLRNIDPIYARQVLETGRLLLSKDPGLLLSWQATQMSKYIDLKQGRADIEKNLLRRKKFNG